MPVVHCPTCRQALTVGDSLGGTVVTCPTCQQPMTLPPMPAAPAVATQPNFVEQFAVPARPARREPEPAPARGSSTNWTLIALGGGAAALLGLVVVGVALWVLVGRTTSTPSTKDKGPAAKAAPAPQPKGKVELLAATTPARMDDANIARVKKATVYIRIRDAKGVSSGSGFFVEPGLIVTNHHVINHPGRLEVVTQSGTVETRTYPARVLFQDAAKDLALVEAAGATAPGVLQVGDTTALRETHEVYAFGFPLGERAGQEITVTKTTVSSIRTGGDRKRREVQLNGGLEHGNSGGPVTDVTGRVVGVAVSKFDNTSVHFAIAAEEVTQFLARYER
ncbi:MAG: serine protease [Gemmataceae bacterium]